MPTYLSEQTTQSNARILSLRGLSASEVMERRTNGNGNMAPQKTSRSYLQIVRENVFTSINTILFVLGITLIMLGQISDALVSVSVVFINVLVSIVQEIRAKRTLDRIALLTRPQAVVMREGQERIIDPDEIVVGDLLVVRPGDQIVVDGPVVDDGRIEIDESLLSGEADPVSKRTGDWLYSGSFCVSGGGYYRAKKVGSASVANQFTAGARSTGTDGLPRSHGQWPGNGARREQHNAWTWAALDARTRAGTARTFLLESAPGHGTRLEIRVPQEEGYDTRPHR